MQNIFVLGVVAACAIFAVGGIVRTLFGKKSCCAKGCGSVSKSAKPQAAERIVFLPVEMLGKPRAK